MTPISYVICAAGKGQRFKDYALAAPKPLLKLNGKSMLSLSLESLNLKKQDQVIIISQKKDSLPLKTSLPCHVEWLEIEVETRGQLDTFLLAKDLIKYEDIVIYNCDTYFESSELLAMIESQKFSGIIPCSKQPGHSWSFCLVNEEKRVLKVTEKDRISDWASVGYYYFKGKNRLIQFAQIECQQVALKETYVAPLYNIYLSEGDHIQMAEVEKFLPFGTVEQVKDYWGLTIETLIQQNS